jgi:UDP-N-acetylglucosamine 4,6-dehydratase
MKRVLITGVTGTMGQELSRLLLKHGYHVTGISRDEQKQQQLPVHENLDLRIADVRDGASVARVAQRIDLVFHLAALKCVDVLEYHPYEAFQTNVIGTQNVIDIAEAQGANLVFTSTDKACYPVNNYGMTKALAERMVVNAGYTVARYGNVLGSRGSFLPSLILSLKTNSRIRITHHEMTRFWMSAPQVSSFLLECASGKPGGVKIPNGIRASSIIAFAGAVAKFCGIEKYRTEYIGIRPGEKLHETLQTAEEGGIISSKDTHRHFDQQTLNRFIIDVLKGKK